MLYMAAVNSPDEFFSIRSTIRSGVGPLAPSVACQVPVTSAADLAAVIMTTLIPTISMIVPSQTDGFRRSLPVITPDCHRTDGYSCTLRLAEKRSEIGIDIPARIPEEPAAGFGLRNNVALVKSARPCISLTSSKKKSTQGM